MEHFANKFAHPARVRHREVELTEELWQHYELDVWGDIIPRRRCGTHRHYQHTCSALFEVIAKNMSPGD